MDLITLFTGFLSVVVVTVFGQVEFCELYPPEVEECFGNAKYHPISPLDAHTACIKEFYVDLEPDLNLTRADRSFFDLRAQNKYGLGPPPTGPRIRKEYRRLTKEEKIRLHSAFNVLYKNGIIHKFGRLHAAASNTVHRGASFLAWHRVMLADLEEELRRVDPTVALAYWDHTMDINMTKPSDSVLWTPCFFGNGNGTVTEGPFRGWYGGRLSPIQRDYARDACDNGRLTSKNDILRILSKCHIEEVSVPPEDTACVLEAIHDAVHEWVGGDMNDLFLSAFDPVFYFHHAFVDYIWELFRRNQVTRCGVDPETDYPVDKYSTLPDRQGHRAFDRMYGYEHLRNIDGLSHIFIEKYYKYETLPQCPDCGSSFLYCDVKKQMCVSKDKSACDIPPGRNTYTGSGFENVHIGFSGPLSPGFKNFPNKHPFANTVGTDPRHRDMTHKEALRAIGEDVDKMKMMPFSPVLPLFPSIPGSFKGPAIEMGPPANFDPLYTPLTWPYAPDSRPPPPLPVGKFGLGPIGGPILPPIGPINMMPAGYGGEYGGRYGKRRGKGYY